MMRSAIVAFKTKRKDRGQHAGLLLQRYLCENATGDDGNTEEKRAILLSAINAATNEDVRVLYKSAFNRWSASLPTEPAPVDLQTAGRLIVGLGSENILETGIRLHHNYGMPIIPGSALKGLAAHYCDQVWGERDSLNPSEQALPFRSARKADKKNNRPAEPAGKYHQLLFGTTDDSGCIVFHDAWYVPESSPQPLVLDVMTPHHPKWLDGSAPPTDFDSPRPVPFLSVKGSVEARASTPFRKSSIDVLSPRLTRVRLSAFSRVLNFSTTTVCGQHTGRSVMQPGFSANSVRMAAWPHSAPSMRSNPNSSIANRSKLLSYRSRWGRL